MKGKTSFEEHQKQEVQGFHKSSKGSHSPGCLLFARKQLVVGFL